MEQTAVEWLLKQMEVCNYISKKQLENCNSWLTQEAKEMEKQQIIDTWTDGKYCNTIGNEINYEDGEQYYNETFKQL